MPDVADPYRTMKALANGASQAPAVMLSGTDRTNLINLFQSLPQWQELNNKLISKGFTLNRANDVTYRVTIHNQAGVAGPIDCLEAYATATADQREAAIFMAKADPSISPDAGTQVNGMLILTNNRPMTAVDPAIAVSQLPTYYWWNGMPLFFATVWLWVPFGVIWPYYYWWYDSHRHRNWWYKCYFWWWCSFKSWQWGWPFWWNWWFGWVFHRYFYGWSWHIPY